MNIDRENTAERQQGQPYKASERFASMTIHFMYGFSEQSQFSSVSDYLNDKKYALTADLAQEGFSPEQIEEAVNSGLVKVAPVFRKRVIGFVLLAPSCILLIIFSSLKSLCSISTKKPF